MPGSTFPMRTRRCAKDSATVDMTLFTLATAGRPQTFVFSLAPGSDPAPLAALCRMRLWRPGKRSAGYRWPSYASICNSRAILWGCGGYSFLAAEPHPPCTGTHHNTPTLPEGSAAQYRRRSGARLRPSAQVQSSLPDMPSSCRTKVSGSCPQSDGRVRAVTLGVRPLCRRVARWQHRGSKVRAAWNPGVAVSVPPCGINGPAGPGIRRYHSGLAFRRQDEKK